MSRWFGSLPTVVSVAVDHTQSKLRAADVDGETTYSILLALIEAIGNVIRHASANHKGFELNVGVTETDVVVEVVDFGPGFTLTKRTMPDVMAESGRGIPLMQPLCDSVIYRRGPQRNSLLLKKRVA